MTSDEKLIAQATKELLEASTVVDLAGQIVVGTATDDLKMPYTVVSVKFTSEESGSSLPKEYEMTAELHSIASIHPEDTVDDIFKAIGNALTGSVPSPTPVTLAANFAYFRIESQSSSDHTPGDTTSRTRSYRVFASLL